MAELLPDNPEVAELSHRSALALCRSGHHLLGVMEKEEGRKGVKVGAEWL